MCTLLLECQAARLELIAPGFLDVTAEEMLAKTKSTREIEDNRDVGPRISHRWHYRLAHLRPARSFKADAFRPRPRKSDLE